MGPKGYADYVKKHEAKETADDYHCDLSTRHRPDAYKATRLRMSYLTSAYTEKGRIAPPASLTSPEILTVRSLVSAAGRTKIL